MSAPGLAQVGRECVPALVPEGELSDQEAYLEGDNAACGDGVCLGSGVAGDPRPECPDRPGACFASDPACRGEARCADPADVQRHVHCSCRCDAPDAQAALCACPDGFICVPVLEQGSPSVVGSYCVRN